MTTMNRPSRRDICRVLASGAGSLALAPDAPAESAAPSGGARPNIVYILADDLGWGDPACYNPDSAIPMPNANRLASQGMRFPRYAFLVRGLHSQPVQHSHRTLLLADAAQERRAQRLLAQPH